MNAIRLAPLDTPTHKTTTNHNNSITAAAAGGGGIMAARKSFSEAQSGQGQGQAGEAEEVDGKKKDDVRMRVGYYQMDKKHHVRYAFIPKAMLRNPQVSEAPFCAHMYVLTYPPYIHVHDY